MQTRTTTRASGRAGAAKRIARAAAIALAGGLLLAACGGGSDGPGFVFAAPPPPPPPPAPPPPPEDGPMVRRTSAGKVEGVDDSARSGTWFWKGVPFAQPPVGALRWRAPAEPQPWSGVRSAARFGSACLQIGRIFGPGLHNTYDETIGTTLGMPLGSEDCLFLNLWRPASDEKNLPVLLFVHGGSNISGYTADPLYDGAALARAANAVVVTVNYRLGVLGFLHLPQLRTGDGSGADSGNFALLDILAALRFVRDNAEAFGGDAGRVTLAGESAGATNLLALMTSPKAEGLFHRAIEMSGGISLAANLPPGASPALVPAAASLAQGQAIAERLLVADGTAADAAAARDWIAAHGAAELAERLRAHDGPALLRTVLAAGLSSVAPIPDGSLIPTDPIGAIAAGRYVKVPLIAGTTRDEGKLFAPLLAAFGGRPGWIVDDATRFSMMRTFDPEAPGALRSSDIIDASYLPVDRPSTGYDAMTRLITRALFEANRDNLLDTLAARQSEIWSYRFDWAQQAAPWNEVYGAAHAFDLPFVFGNFGPSLIASVTVTRANAPGRIALSNAMMAGLGAFMRTGDPNTAALGATWARWPSKLLFDATPSAAAIRPE